MAAEDGGKRARECRFQASIARTCATGDGNDLAEAQPRDTQARMCRSYRVTTTLRRCRSIITVEKAGVVPASRLRTPPPARAHWLPHHRLSSLSRLPHRNHQPQPASNMPTISTPRPGSVCPSKKSHISATQGPARKFPLSHSVLPATTRQARCTSVARPFVISIGERSCNAQSAKS